MIGFKGKTQLADMLQKNSAKIAGAGVKASPSRTSRIFGILRYGPQAPALKTLAPPDVVRQALRCLPLNLFPISWSKGGRKHKRHGVSRQRRGSHDTSRCR